MDERHAETADGVDAVDLARYDRLGETWWDPAGPMGQLHAINPVRLRYLTGRVARHRPAAADRALPLAGLRVLDIGCGGGLLCEPLARLGAAVTGLDPAPNNIRVARAHAAAAGLAIDYRAATAEALAAAGARFDLVLAMEVVEHVTDRDAFLATAAALVEPGGLFMGSTLNRTARSFALAIVGAEYILRWLPRGTHRWSQFVTPAEFALALRRSGLRLEDTTGMVYDPLRDAWRLSPDTAVNYFVTAARPTLDP